MRGRTGEGPEAATARPGSRAGRTARRVRAARRGTAALPVTAAVLCLASACGVPPSGVVEVGEPATGMAVAHVVYFWADEDGGEDTAAGRAVESGRASAGRAARGRVLRAVARPGAPGSDLVVSTVDQLLEGPTSAESHSLRTALPLGLRGPEVTVSARARGGDVLTLRFPAGTPPFSADALRQLRCTAARAHTAERATGPDVTAPPTGAAPAPASTSPADARQEPRPAAPVPSAEVRVTVAGSGSRGPASAPGACPEPGH